MVANVAWIDCSLLEVADLVRAVNIKSGNNSVKQVRKCNNFMVMHYVVCIYNYNTGHIMYINDYICIYYIHYLVLYTQYKLYTRTSIKNIHSVILISLNVSCV